jgi:predicted secreted protein
MVRLLMLAALVAGGCAGRPPAVQTLTEADEGSRTTVRVGDVVAIELRTPTSGLGAWRALDPPGGVLRREPGPDYDRDPAAAGLARAAGLSTWRYSADAPGSATLRFEFVGTGVPETREFPVTVAPRRGR